MMRLLSTVASDARGMARVFGLAVAAQWLLMIALHPAACLRRRNLRPADRALGDGPFRARQGGVTAWLAGDVISSAREIWARDVYLDDGFLQIPENARVVDLGANRAVFTLLALAHGPDVHVVSVEADQRFHDHISHVLELNDWASRVQLVRAYVGGKTKFQEALDAKPDQDSIPWMTADELIESCRIDRIDFLKCDIEGSEFELLTRESRLLSMARQIAIELHRWAGDPDEFVMMLEEIGFETRRLHEAPNAVVVLGRRKEAASDHAGAT